jgi:hypothetical protein
MSSLSLILNSSSWQTFQILPVKWVCAGFSLWFSFAYPDYWSSWAPFPVTWISSFLKYPSNHLLIFLLVVCLCLTDFQEFFMYSGSDLLVYRCCGIFSPFVSTLYTLLWMSLDKPNYYFDVVKFINIFSLFVTLFLFLSPSFSWNYESSHPH